MKKVFISGSISIKELPDEIKTSLNNIKEKNIAVLVGDAKGVDTLIQKYFSKTSYDNVTICSIYDTPRNRTSARFKTITVDAAKSIKSERKRQEIKDEYMTLNSTYSFVIWDGKSKGSFNNINRALEQKKLLKVFYTKESRYLNHSEITKENIKKIYEDNNGITLKDLSKYTNLSLDTLKENIKKYKDYWIINSYRGKENYRYDTRLINILKQESLFEQFANKG